MPHYDYACEACGHTFEAYQSMQDKLLKKCPGCKKNTLIRLFGGGIVLEKSKHDCGPSGSP